MISSDFSENSALTFAENVVKNIWLQGFWGNFGECHGFYRERSLCARKLLEFLCRFRWLKYLVLTFYSFGLCVRGKIRNKVSAVIFDLVCRSRSGAWNKEFIVFCFQYTVRLFFYCSIFFLFFFSLWLHFIRPSGAIYSFRFG